MLLDILGISIDVIIILALIFCIMFGGKTERYWSYIYFSNVALMTIEFVCAVAVYKTGNNFHGLTYIAFCKDYNFYIFRPVQYVQVLAFVIIAYHSREIWPVFGAAFEITAIASTTISVFVKVPDRTLDYLVTTPTELTVLIMTVYVIFNLAHFKKTSIFSQLQRF